jgi:hypothetical protein
VSASERDGVPVVATISPSTSSSFLRRKSMVALMVAGVLRCVKSLSREFEPTGRRFDPRRGSVESRWAFHRKIGQQIQERMKGSFQEMTKNGFRPPCQRALTDAARGGVERFRYARSTHSVRVQYRFSELEACALKRASLRASSSFRTLRSLPKTE